MRFFLCLQVFLLVGCLKQNGPTDLSLTETPASTCPSDLVQAQQLAENLFLKLKGTFYKVNCAGSENGSCQRATR